VSSSRVFVRKNKIAASFWIGAILILTGIGLAVYADSMIKGLQQKLLSNLTREERWAYEGAYEWWRINKVTLFDPVSLILMAVGLVAISYSFICAIQYRAPSSVPSNVEARSYQQQPEAEVN